MNYLFLRGQVPIDRDPQEIVFDTIEKVDDMWTQLLFTMTGKQDHSELWYWGGVREKRFSNNFVERWVPSFSTYKNSFYPDVIFCRGGFDEYECIIKRFPKAFKIYYGAGRRFLPSHNADMYNLILQDSPRQRSICQTKFPKIRSELFIKPAADNIFYPRKVDKKFDACFPANGKQETMKGHGFVFSTCPRELSILNIGNKGKLPAPNNITRIRLLRSSVSEYMQKCSVGIVCSSGKVDSCPRVIPELLASGVPVVVLNETHIWEEKYINSRTGKIASRENFWLVVSDVLRNLESYQPRVFYEENLSLKKSAEYLVKLINS
jgi:hypothetical protein